MNKDNAPKWIELGSAMLQGKTIQRMNRGEWVNVTDLNTISYDPESYRIKPEPKKGWYRNYVCKNGDVEVVNKLTLNDQEKAEAVWSKKSFQFSCWLTDRIEYTLPEGDA